MSDIFREVDEEVRREQYLKLWRTYGKYAIAVALAIVIGVAGYQGFREYERRQAQGAAERFALALADARSGKAREAAAAFESLAADAPAGYRALAELQAAANFSAAGDGIRAVEIYDRLAGSRAPDSRIPDLARILAAMLLLEDGKIDEAEARLQPVAAGSGAFRHSARELAALARLKAGDTKGAREKFAELSDDATTPPGIRARAAELLAALPEAK
ncbi:MAG: tetratricopeptide repeat protein [Alphaproteobacteria bacterium]|nr:tetratricopeptide repeat protein [Alphaproteobacteria bacterium]